MRKILFRGKQRLAGNWCEGFLVKTGDHFRISTRNDMISFGVDPETVGECAGLTDKNGRLIFEGDIVTGLFLFGMEIKAVIVFRDGAFGLQWYRGSIEEFSAFTSLCNVTYEVIGNIHDNKELLES